MRFFTRMLCMLLLITPTLTCAQERVVPEEATEEPTWEQERISSLDPEELTRTPDFSNQLIQTLTSLGLVVLVMFGLAWALKKVLNQRMVQMNSTSAIKILEQRNLSPKSALYLLEAEGRTVLVGESAAGLVKLAELDSASSEGPTPFEGVYAKRGMQNET